MESDPLQFIMKRRSVREFTGEPVSREALVTALRAAMAAPSANNRRPWQFLVVSEPDAARAVCAAHPYARFGDRAGAVILPFGERFAHRWFDQDMGAATENLLLALANLGLGATWCGLDEGLQQKIRPLIGLPEHLWAFALIPVGIPVDPPPPRTQYEDARVHWERYRG
jgi:nitroreductase